MITRSQATPIDSSDELPRTDDPPAAAGVAEREEADWLIRAGEGDIDDSFVDLYRRYEGRIYGLGLRMLGDRGLAEELVQETFIRLWRSADGYRPERGPVRSYVFTIARRAAISLWRRPSSRPLEPPPLAEAGVEDRAEEVVLAVTVRDAMTALSAEHREILTLCVDRDMTQAQAAAHLGIPVGTVKSRTHHALKSLHDALAQRGIVA